MWLEGLLVGLYSRLGLVNITYRHLAGVGRSRGVLKVVACRLGNMWFVSLSLTALHSFSVWWSLKGNLLLWLCTVSSWDMCWTQFRNYGCNNPFVIIFYTHHDVFHYYNTYTTLSKAEHLLLPSSLTSTCKIHLLLLLLLLYVLSPSPLSSCCTLLCHVWWAKFMDLYLSHLPPFSLAELWFLSLEVCKTGLPLGANLSFNVQKGFSPGKKSKGKEQRGKKWRGGLQ